MRLKLLEIKESTGKRIRTYRDVFELMEEESKADRECSWVLHLNAQYHVIEKELVSIGTLYSAYASPREIFKKAIVNSADSIICIHNHPSGDPVPSDEDMQVYERLVQAGKMLGIPILDSIILGRDHSFSFYKAIQSRAEKEEPKQMELFMEQEMVCLECGEWLKKENVIEENGRIYCPYCWEVIFGERNEDWIPKTGF